MATMVHLPNERNGVHANFTMRGVSDDQEERLYRACQDGDLEELANQMGQWKGLRLPVRALLEAVCALNVEVVNYLLMSNIDPTEKGSCKPPMHIRIPGMKDRYFKNTTALALCAQIARHLPRAGYKLAVAKLLLKWLKPNSKEEMDYFIIDSVLADLGWDTTIAGSGEKTSGAAADVDEGFEDLWSTFSAIKEASQVAVVHVPEVAEGSGDTSQKGSGSGSGNGSGYIKDGQKFSVAATVTIPYKGENGEEKTMEKTLELHEDCVHITEVLRLLQELGHAYTLEEIENSIPPIPSSSAEISDRKGGTWKGTELAKWIGKSELKRMLAGMAFRAFQNVSKYEDFGKSVDKGEPLTQAFTNLGLKLSTAQRTMVDDSCDGDSCTFGRYLGASLRIMAQNRPAAWLLRCCQGRDYMLACFDTTTKPAVVAVCGLFAALAILCLVMCAVSHHIVHSDNTNFEPIIENWALKPVESAALISVSEVCPTGYEKVQMLWPGAQSSCVCPSTAFAAGYVSTADPCTPDQLNYDCINSGTLARQNIDVYGDDKQKSKATCKSDKSVCQIDI
jgi:hypothetical protein